MSAQQNNVAGFKCVECAVTYDLAEIEYVCPACGGNLDVLYDYDWISKRLSKDSLAADQDFSISRYRALLPIADTSRLPRSQWDGPRFMTARAWPRNMASANY